MTPAAAIGLRLSIDRDWTGRPTDSTALRSSRSRLSFRNSPGTREIRPYSEREREVERDGGIEQLKERIQNSNIKTNCSRISRRAPTGGMEQKGSCSRFFCFSLHPSVRSSRPPAPAPFFRRRPFCGGRFPERESEWQSHFWQRPTSLPADERRSFQNQEVS